MDVKHLGGGKITPHPKIWTKRARNLLFCMVVGTTFYFSEMVKMAKILMTSALFVDDVIKNQWNQDSHAKHDKKWTTDHRKVVNPSNESRYIAT